MLSSLSEAMRQSELRAIGIESYLVKPVKQSRLFECLLDVMGHTAAIRGSAPPLDILPEKPPESGSPAPFLRILLVEDNRVNQRVALAQLHKLGFAAHAVDNGLEALEALKQAAYDVVLMDLSLIHI